MHALPLPELEKQLDTQFGQGLTTAEAEARIKKHGPNALKEAEEISLWRMVLSQFKSPIVFLLLFSAGLSFFFQEWADGIAILIVLLINAVIGFAMEYRALTSMKALKRMTVTLAKVYRQGTMTELSAEDLVPGDILFLEAGDIVPADARLITATRLSANESALTGESVPVEKVEKELPEEALPADRVNMLFKGTHITGGNARAVVTHTGMHTEIGKIAHMLHASAQQATPLEKKLEVFSNKLIILTVGIVVVIFGAGLLHGEDFKEMLTTSIALAVASIPEGLPIVATLALARGMLVMARYNVIVKKLSSIETLGGAHVICTDKTGTLTQNRIEVETWLPAGGAKDYSHILMLQAAVLCNTAERQGTDDDTTEIGDPLELGLLKYAQVHTDAAALWQTHPKIDEEPFSSETKIMATLHQTKAGLMVMAKGAAEELLGHCTGIMQGEQVVPISDSERQKWMDEANHLADTGLKAIAFGWKEVSNTPSSLTDELVFTGMAGLMDPLRPEVEQAVRECRSAGVKVVMITGDHPATAANIGRRIGLAGSADAAMHGKDMKPYDQLTDKDKQQWLNTSIFARVTPKQKLDLVSVWQEAGHTVAMTGDGVNDAPALKKADIGIAMGLRGTQVARDVADMVLKDDAFQSLVVAVRQGRIIFDNIRKFVMYLLSCNLSEILLIAILAVLGLDFRLIPLQILFINLVTDVLPALALGMSRGSKWVMQHPPRDISAPIIDNKQWQSVIVYAAVIALFAIAGVGVGYLLPHGADVTTPGVQNNILFYSLILSQLLHAFNLGHCKERLMGSEAVKNKYLWYAMAICVAITVLVLIVPVTAIALDLEPLHPYAWITIFVSGLGSFIVIRVLKKLQLIL